MGSFVCGAFRSRGPKGSTYPGDCLLSYGVVIRPLLVATIHRLPHRTIESTLPTPGTVSPRVALTMPSGPSKTTAPPTTSRIVQPGMVVGRVSGVGVVLGLDKIFASGEAVLRCATGEAGYVEAASWAVAWPRPGLGVVGTPFLVFGTLAVTRPISGLGMQMVSFAEPRVGAEEAAVCLGAKK